MKIETLDDANSVIAGCGCCPMPTCPSPSTECRSIEAYAASEGHWDYSIAEWKIHRKRTDLVDFTEAYSDTFRSYNATAHEYYHDEFDQNYKGSINNGLSGCTVWTATLTQTCDTEGSATDIVYDGEWNGSEWVRGGVRVTTTTTRTNLTGTPIPDSDPPASYRVCTWMDEVSWNYEDDEEGEDGGYIEWNISLTTMYPLMGGTVTFNTIHEFTKTFSEWMEDTQAVLEDALDSASEHCWSGESCESRIQQSHAEAPAVGTHVWLRITRSQYRWVVPDSWQGSYFKITWDVLEEPDGWNANPPTTARSFVSQDNTWVWMGPGDPDDPESWKSGWHDLGIPADKGKRRIVNVRHECYKSSRLGMKPHATGDAVELPDS
jgi:hypothetical protein